MGKKIAEHITYLKELINFLSEPVCIYKKKGKEYIVEFYNQSFKKFEQVNKFFPPAIDNEVPNYLYKICESVIKDKATYDFNNIYYQKGVCPNYRGKCSYISATEGDYIILNIKSTEYRRELENITFRDSLTAIYNRRFLDNYLLEFKNPYPITIAMLDVNGLKVVNDILGHSFGDELLVRASKLIEQTFDNCIVGRYGGDEFLVISGYDDIDLFKTKAEKFKKIIMPQNKNDLPVSIAIGVFRQANSKQSIKNVIELAEKDMYENKYSSSFELNKEYISTLLNLNIITKEQLSKFLEKINEKVSIYSDLIK
ncbi:MAG: GGDEF domain-containing protein [Clostridia bacterium]